MGIGGETALLLPESIPFLLDRARLVRLRNLGHGAGNVSEAVGFGKTFCGSEAVGRVPAIGVVLVSTACAPAPKARCSRQPGATPGNAPGSFDSHPLALKARFIRKRTR